MEQTNLTKIRQPYVLTMAKHKLNVHEMRIILRIVEALQDKMKQNVQKDLFGKLSLHLKTKTLLPPGSKNHSLIKQALKSLMEKVIEVPREDKHGAYTALSAYISQAKIYHNNQFIEIGISDEAILAYLELARGYTRYALEVAFSSNSSYTMKLYQFISHWKDKSAITVDYWELRGLLGVESKYKQIVDFKKRVLDPAKNELKEKGDIWFDYKDIKTGRSITGFVFQIFRRVTDEKERVYASAQEQNITNMLRNHFNVTESHLKTLRPIIRRGDLQQHIIDKLLKLAEEVASKRGQIKNVASYATKSLLNEFGDLGTGQEKLFK